MNDTAIVIKQNVEVVGISAISTMQNLINSSFPCFIKSKDERNAINSGKSFLWKTTIIPLAHHKGRLLSKGAHTDISSCFSPDALSPSNALINPGSRRCSCCPFNNIFARKVDISKCILIHTILALTLRGENLVSLSFQEAKAQDLKLLLAAIDLAGGELKQYQVEMEISLSYQRYLCLNEIKFSNLKRFKKVALNLPNPSLLKDWKPAWLGQVNSKVSKLIDPPVLGEHGTH